MGALLRLTTRASQGGLSPSSRHGTMPPSSSSSVGRLSTHGYVLAQITPRCRAAAAAGSEDELVEERSLECEVRLDVRDAGDPVAFAAAARAAATRGGRAAVAGAATAAAARSQGASTSAAGDSSNSVYVAALEKLAMRLAEDGRGARRGFAADVRTIDADMKRTPHPRAGALVAAASAMAPEDDGGSKVSSSPLAPAALLSSTRLVLLSRALQSREGYCQGMNHVAAMLLDALDAPESAHRGASAAKRACALAALEALSRALPDYWNRSIAGVNADLQVLRALCRMLLPSVSAHLDALGVELAWVMPSIIVSAGAGVLPYNTAAWVVAMCLDSGHRAPLLYTALAVMKTVEAELLREYDAGRALVLLGSAARRADIRRPRFIHTIINYFALGLSCEDIDAFTPVAEELPNPPVLLCALCGQAIDSCLQAPPCGDATDETPPRRREADSEDVASASARTATPLRRQQSGPPGLRVPTSEPTRRTASRTTSRSNGAGGRANTCAGSASGDDERAAQSAPRSVQKERERHSHSLEWSSSSKHLSQQSTSESLEYLGPSVAQLRSLEDDLRAKDGQIAMLQGVLQELTLQVDALEDERELQVAAMKNTLVALEVQLQVAQADAAQGWARAVALGVEKRVSAWQHPPT